MTHERYALTNGRTLQCIQGRIEWWLDANGHWLYNRDTRKWVRAELTA